MKKILCIVLTIVMLASLLAVPTGAKGYTLSVPKTVNAHNLNSYGLRTLNVYETATPPTIDGAVGEGEYPGPDNGMADSVSVKGETEDGYYNHGLWMSSHSSGNWNGYSGSQDFTGFTSENDVPKAVETYLTYDQEFLYYAIVYRHMPGQRTALVSGRTGSMVFDTRVNFMQSSNPAEVAGSVAWNRFNILISTAADADTTTAGTAYVYNAYSSTRSGRQIRQVLDGKDSTYYIGYYVAADGTAWGGDGSGLDQSNLYKDGKNTRYNVTVLDDTFVDEKGGERHYWDMTVEGRMPLGDVLRISDVVYDDGSPIDYVPEWGAWGTSLRIYSSSTVESVAPNGTEVTITYDEPIVIQTALPLAGMAYTAANSRVANFEFHGTAQSAFATASGSVTSGLNVLFNPVHFLGVYDDGAFDMDTFYGSGVDSSSSIATSSTRATRRRNPNMQEFDGSRARVIGVSSRASSATGDEAIWIVLAVSAMVLCAAGVVTVVLLNKKKKNNVR